MRPTVQSAVRRLRGKQVVEVLGTQLAGHSPSPGEVDEHLQPSSFRGHVHSMSHDTPNGSGTLARLLVMSKGIITCMILAFLCNMVPAQGQGIAAGVATLRTPPQWGPEREAQYAFREWARDLMIWSIHNSDMDARRKAAAVVMRLTGGARELIRDLPPQTLMQGGLVEGQLVDPMTYIMHTLAERYGRLGEEVRLEAISNLMISGDSGTKASTSS